MPVKGLIFEGQRRVALADIADPVPADGQVVVRVAASGMCGSDLHYYRADAPMEAGGAPCVGGHEPAGTIEALGPGVDTSRLSEGDRVMVHHYSGCGGCTACRSGWTQMCSTRPALVYGKNAHGAHAPFMSVDAQAVLPLPDALSFVAGAAIGCGTGTAWGALERIGDVGGRDVVVFGQGPVGQSVTMLASARGARVIAVDPSPGRREHALTFGAAAAIDSLGDPVEAVRDLTGGAGAYAAIETSGAPAAADAAVSALAPWGTFCAVGLGGAFTFDVRALLPRQLTFVTSWSMSSVQQIACAAFIARHGLPIDDLFTDEWRLEEAEQAYAAFDQQTAGKAAFVF
jgi:threonine dehydrogenase-like Zn-dependent dehydrogenase